MCGRLNVTDDPFVQELLKTLGVSGQNIRFSADVAPGAPVSIIKEIEGSRVVSDATWWLLLDKDSLKEFRGQFTQLRDK